MKKTKLFSKTEVFIVIVAVAFCIACFIAWSLNAGPNPEAESPNKTIVQSNDASIGDSSYNDEPHS